jgi:hypothetical protein
MIDLTNRMVNQHLLLQKFAPVLETIKNKETHVQLAYILDVAVKYINNNHPQVDSDWKTWCAVAIKDIFLKYPLKINNEKDIENLIDAFMKFYNENYEIYLNNVAMFVNEYYRDYPFVDKYIKQVTH